MISCISFELPSHAEKDGSEMKLLAPGINKLWPNLERDVHKKRKEQHFMSL